MNTKAQPAVRQHLDVVVQLVPILSSPVRSPPRQ